MDLNLTGFKETNIPPSGSEVEEVIVMERVGRASLLRGCEVPVGDGRKIPAAGYGPVLKTADKIYRKSMIRNKIKDATE